MCVVHGMYRRGYGLEHQTAGQVGMTGLGSESDAKSGSRVGMRLVKNAEHDDWMGDIMLVRPGSNIRAGMSEKLKVGDPRRLPRTNGMLYRMNCGTAGARSEQCRLSIGDLHGSDIFQTSHDVGPKNGNPRSRQRARGREVDKRLSSNGLSG